MLCFLRLLSLLISMFMLILLLPQPWCLSLMILLVLLRLLLPRLLLICLLSLSLLLLLPAMLLLLLLAAAFLVKLSFAFLVLCLVLCTPFCRLGQPLLRWLLFLQFFLRSRLGVLLSRLALSSSSSVFLQCCACTRRRRGNLLFSFFRISCGCRGSSRSFS